MTQYYLIDRQIYNMRLSFMQGDSKSGMEDTTMKDFKVGKDVQVTPGDGSIAYGTVTRVGIAKLRVLFPISKSVWVSKDCCKAVN
jgi:hypothetical protein